MWKYTYFQVPSCVECGNRLCVFNSFFCFSGVPLAVVVKHKNKNDSSMRPRCHVTRLNGPVPLESVGNRYCSCTTYSCCQSFKHVFSNYRSISQNSKHKWNENEWNEMSSPSCQNSTNLHSKPGSLLSEQNDEHSYHMNISPRASVKHWCDEFHFHQNTVENSVSHPLPQE